MRRPDRRSERNGVIRDIPLQNLADKDPSPDQARSRTIGVTLDARVPKVRDLDERSKDDHVGSVDEPINIEYRLELCGGRRGQEQNQERDDPETCEHDHVGTAVTEMTGRMAQKSRALPPDAVRSVRLQPDLLWLSNLGIGRDPEPSKRFVSKRDSRHLPHRLRRLLVTRRAEERCHDDLRCPHSERARFVLDFVAVEHDRCRDLLVRNDELVDSTEETPVVRIQPGSAAGTKNWILQLPNPPPERRTPGRPESFGLRGSNLFQLVREHDGVSPTDAFASGDRKLRGWAGRMTRSKG